MCVAGLNVSTQPCGHRWYELVRACHPANNLANCPERLKLEGWETRNDDCPFCDNGKVIHSSTHRLFGSVSSSASVASSSGSSDAGAVTRYRRSGSSGTINTLSRQSSVGSGEPELDRGLMQREMNDRLLTYLTSDPHEVLPSARKNYPTFSGAREDSSPSDAASITSVNGKFVRGWNRGVRFSKNIFRT